LTTELQVSDFDFKLPPDRIAQQPARPRESARLLQIIGDLLSGHTVGDLPNLLRPGDLLVANDTRVIPGQLWALRGEARIGLTLDQPRPDGTWHALARNARRLRVGDTLAMDGLAATVEAVEDGGGVVLRFDRDGDAFDAALAHAGRLALPPYIFRADGPTVDDAADYQTVFAREPGAVAAPTAGLHFTPALLDRLAARGIGRVTITLHVGAGTFLPMRSELVEGHRMHAERGVVSAEASDAIAATRAAGGRIVAIGTTVLRLLESAVDANGVVRPFAGSTDIFLRPGHAFRTADLLLTNFHLPRSTLFMLACAFGGTAAVRAAYAHAVEAEYRFYSYGDACLLGRA